MATTPTIQVTIIPPKSRYIVWFSIAISVRTAHGLEFAFRLGALGSEVLPQPDCY